MYAIFRAAGFQVRAEPGTLLKLPPLPAQAGEVVTFDEVLLGSTGEDVLVGRPLLPGARVDAEVLRHGRGKKIIVWKFRRRKNYRRKRGHRQGFTEVRVSRIDLGDGRGAEGLAPAAEAKAASPKAEAGAAVAPAKKRRAAPRAKAEGAAKPKTRAKATGAASEKEKGAKKKTSPRKGKKE
ncbi:MAG: 50S ribosomal protein L21 [Gemmatimonadetes bacterium]|nr:50S ribosomal protein L21 [Gemmatimonadota bacterium]